LLDVRFFAVLFAALFREAPDRDGLLRVALFRPVLFRPVLFRAVLLDADFRPEAPFRPPLADDRFRVADPPVFRLRVAAALRAEADRADLGRDAEARPPARPPLRAGARLVRFPRPEPLLRPPPDILFSVAQARRSASFSGTPRLS